MARMGAACTVEVAVYNTSTYEWATGQAANLSLVAIADGVSLGAVDATPVEIDADNAPGRYRVALTAAENAGSSMSVAGTCSTADCIVIPAVWMNSIIPATAATLTLAGTTVTGNEFEVQVPRGDAYTLTVSIVDADGDPVNLTAYTAEGASIKLTVKAQEHRADDDDANALFQVTGECAAPTTGVVTFALTAAHTEAASLGVVYDADVQGDAGAGAIRTLALGTYESTLDVTRKPASS